MVGVCIIVISIVKGMPPDMVHYLIDKALAIDSLLFTISALLSFLSIRLERATLRFERWAEMIFIVGVSVNDNDSGDFFFRNRLIGGWFRLVFFLTGTAFKKRPDGRVRPSPDVNPCLRPIFA